MNVGKLVGYAIIALVDSLIPPVVMMLVVLLLIPAELLTSAVLPYVFVLGCLSFVSTLLVAFVSAYRGGKPFPVTRGAKYLFDVVPLWWP